MTIRSRLADLLRSSTELLASKLQQHRLALPATVPTIVETTAKKQSPTFGEYAEQWITRRVATGYRSEIDARCNLKNHLLPVFADRPMSEVTPTEVRDFVSSMREKKQRNGKPLANRTVLGVYALLRAIFKTALRREIIDRDPCILGGEDLPENEPARADFQEMAIFSRDEIQILLDLANTNTTGIPFHWLALYRLLMFTGARVGEACALTWDAIDFDAKPLGKIRISKSYSTKRDEVGPTKTKITRQVPIHPQLLATLIEWRDRGYEAEHSEKPTPNGLVFPCRPKKGKHAGRLVPRRNTVVLHRLHRDLESLGMRPRRTHDYRRTFVTFACEAEGADVTILRRVTHTRPGDVHESYREVSWKASCRELAKLTIKDDENDPKDT